MFPEIAELGGHFGPEKNMAVTSISGQKYGQNLKKIPSFIVKNGHQNRHKIVAAFVAFCVSSFSMSLSFSPCFSLLPAVS